MKRQGGVASVVLCVTLIQAPLGVAAGPGSAIWWQNPPEELDRLQNVLTEARATPLSR